MIKSSRCLSAATVVKPPSAIPVQLFLAGSIEMGAAEDWQTKIASLLDDLDITIMNPRRDDWDNSWKQSIDDPNFRGQVEWELTCLDKADVIALYFDPETKAPISLLEFGLHARSGKLAIACPKGFYRRGNIEVTANRYNVPLVETIEELAEEVRKLLKSRNSTKDE